MATYHVYSVNEKLTAALMNQDRADSRDKDGKFWGQLLSAFGYNQNVLNLTVASVYDQTGYPSLGSATWTAFGPTLTITPPVAGNIIVVAWFECYRCLGTGWVESRITRTSGSGGTGHLLNAELRLNDGNRHWGTIALAIVGAAISAQSFRFQHQVQTNPNDQICFGPIRMLGLAF